MADKKEGQSTTPKGADWEVVSLTASAYAAAPGGSFPEFKHEEKGEDVKKDEVESSNALFMSGHFVLPPTQHKNVPSEPENSEIHGQDDGSKSVKVLDGKPDAKEEENWDLRKLTELAFKGKEQSIYGSPTLDSLNSEATIGALNIDDETSVLHESIQSSDSVLSSNIPTLPAKEANHEGSVASWWKKQAASLYAHAKETNTLWSIFAVTAVMGIVIIGYRWRQEKWQVLRHEWKSRIHDEVRV